ncbi:glycosyltransferase [Leptospira santarosai]|uniref:glycosyltransferase n=1 Tax=Leptospira santarosai TaxID=28183 RepID=UPI0024AE9FC4|nr:glycosyltransferase family 2 protein [Leptospira santarosai]MDI7157793.1 glycosyltransferase family 2 protein [Leptospira santarosai]MDI7183505.1 glycosyltransferase family 2 protein [Leptospira santarosai]
MDFGITVSIVLYKPNVFIFKESFSSLLSSVAYQIAHTSKTIRYKIEVLDNSPEYGEEIKTIVDDFAKELSFKNRVEFRYVHFPENPGYGAANNRSILKSNAEFHLVLNPDIKMIPETLELCVRYLSERPDCDAVVPSVWDWENGRNGEHTMQFLVKSYPTVFVLFLRSFAPSVFKKLFRKYLDRYDLKEKDWEQAQEFVPLVSGCFIFARTESLRKIGGFDERFFLYFEDFDLSMRLSRKDYFPKIRIFHKGGNSSRKGFLHIRLFVVSACRFFMKFGWKLI